MSVTVGIVSYGAGNVRSVRNALGRLGCTVLTGATVEDLRRADKIIFPGVGEARSAMSYLREQKLVSWLSDIDRPFLGICLGMQVLYSYSTERDTPCLGILNGDVRKFEGVKVPHIGWNRVSVTARSPLFDGVEDGAFVYYAHSYFAPPTEDSIASTTYGGAMAGAVRRGHYWGVQFHPEKSGAVGMTLLRNFIERC